MERENNEKTSAVHFLRFDLTAAMVQALNGGSALAIGVDHPVYTAKIDIVQAAVRTSLLHDLQW